MSSAHEQASVVEFLDQLAKAWGNNDASELGSLFTDDGTLINPFGQRADSRQAVTAMYAEYFAGMLGGTATTVELQSVRLVGDSHALIDSEQTINATDGSVVLAVHLTALLRRQNEQWLFVDVRPFSFAELPR